MSGTIVISVTGGAIVSPMVPLSVDADPTSATLTFGVSTDIDTAPSTYFQGTWYGSWTSAQLPVYARTPTLGASGATISLTAGTTYILWVQVDSVGSERFGEPVASIRAI